VDAELVRGVVAARRPRCRRRTGIVGLTAGFVGLRLAGQGALGLVATTAAALWFDRRRGTATVGAVGAVGISQTPLLVGIRALEAASSRAPSALATSAPSAAS
jgi:hypothetical protein